MDNYIKLLPELYDKYDIDNAVREVAIKINKDYKNEEVVFIGVLKGSFMFLSDLVKLIDIRHYVDFIAISSYGGSHQGDVKFLLDTRMDVYGKHVILVEDIVDSGNTIEYVKSIFSVRGTKSVKVCTLLDRGISNDISDYVGIKLKTKDWLVGYGLDYKEEYRTLNSIYPIKVIQ